MQADLCWGNQEKRERVDKKIAIGEEEELVDLTGIQSLEAKAFMFNYGLKLLLALPPDGLLSLLVRDSNVNSWFQLVDAKVQRQGLDTTFLLTIPYSAAHSLI